MESRRRKALLVSKLLVGWEQKALWMGAAGGTESRTKDTIATIRLSASLQLPLPPVPLPPPRRQIMLGVDRLDMVKGIPQKLLAYEKFLEEHPEWRDKVGAGRGSGGTKGGTGRGRGGGIRAAE